MENTCSRELTAVASKAYSCSSSQTAPHFSSRPSRAGLSGTTPRVGGGADEVVKVCEVIFQILVFDSDRSPDEYCSPVARDSSDEEPRHDGLWEIDAPMSVGILNGLE